MEFGEKLKFIREEKGLTQQSLADKIFVTRSAVSRWESGARYPDLMTTKKLADYLEVSLDELVSGDDWKDYAEKQPIIENEKTGRIQTATYAITAIVVFVRFCYIFPGLINFIVGSSNEINYILSETSMLISVIPVTINIIMMVLLIYGTIESVKKNVNPKLAGIIAGAYFVGSASFSVSLAYLYGNLSTWTSACIQFMCFVGVGIFFFYRIIKNPYFVYCICVGTILVAVGSDLYSIYCLFASEWDGKTAIIFYNLILNSLSTVFLMILVCYQARLLSQKRKLSHSI